MMIVQLRIDDHLFKEQKINEINRFKEKHPTTRFNHKIYRSMIKKVRRRIVRRQNAQQRDEQIQRQLDDPLYRAWLEHQENLRRQIEIEEQRKTEAARRSWEERERLEEEKNRRIQEEKNRPIVQVVSETSSHNPFAPYRPAVRSTIERPVCSYFMKTGVCRFDERCHRTHEKPGITNTLLAKNMYSNFQIQYSLDNEFDFDIGLEFEETERYENFRDFYFDVRPEFEKHGRLFVFKVCANAEAHLRGNVYVQYETEDQATKAYLALNTRYYAGRMVQCQFVKIANWSSAICGLFQSGKCPKGRRCNYLHVFPDPSTKSIGPKSSLRTS